MKILHKTVASGAAAIGVATFLVFAAPTVATAAPVQPAGSTCPATPPCPPGYHWDIQECACVH